MYGCEESMTTLNLVEAGQLKMSFVQPDTIKNLAKEKCDII
jgi:hypothetical protein